MIAQLSAIGRKITLSVGVNIDSATVMQIKYRKPNGKRGFWTAYKDASSKIAYLTKAGDLNVKGRWRLQAYIETPTWSDHGAITRLDVKDNIL